MKKKNDTNSELIKAIKEAKNHKSVTNAAKKYNIPVRTLRYRLARQSKGFPVKCFSRLQEDVLVNYIKYCAERAFPLTRKTMKKCSAIQYSYTKCNATCMKFKGLEIRKLQSE